jgi:hypothetical protein
MYIVIQSTRYSCQIVIKFPIFQRSFENTQISDFMKPHPLGAELLHAADAQTSVCASAGRTDGQTDMTKLMVTFRNFAKMPKHGFKKYYQPRDYFIKDKKFCLLAESHTNGNGGGIASASY